jgi:EAL and modified HD-GYP domain-containing signal transduction protein
MDDSHVALARQPILAADGTLYAYELLHRDGPQDTAGTAASKSARVVCELLGAIGLDRLAGDARVFVNFEQELLETDLPTILVPNRSVVEILEDVEPRPAVFATLAQLRQRGIEIAIDDFILQSNLLPFLPHVDYVKIDILEAGNQLESIVDMLKEHQVSLLAEKVETHEQFERCRVLGFHYFQGYYFARPEPMAKRSLGAMELSVLTLMAKLENRNVTSTQLTETISVDVALVHQILVLANSGAFYRGRPITSIHEALTMLGQNIIRQWAALLLLTRLGLHKPTELLKLAVTRARLCQTLGTAHHELDPQALFTAGLLSILDALFDRPMEAVLESLPLAAPLKAALCGRSVDALGTILRRAIDYGSGAWVDAGTSDRTASDFNFEVYLDAVEFADHALCA